MAIGALPILALGAIALFSTQTSNPVGVAGSAILYAIATTSAGGLLGFLFGIPRALSSDTSSELDRPRVNRGARFAANTNLEQISDWLTKIIVGVTLTQLGPIKDGAGRLFDAMAPSLGGGEIGAPFAAALVIGFATAGFISSWLLTRLYLGEALATADIAIELLDQADQAEDQGDLPRAIELRREAADALITVAPFAARYEQLRTSQQPGSARTRKLEELVASSRLLAKTTQLSQDAAIQLFDQGKDGDRIMAIALMQGDVSLSDSARLTQAIGESRSAFEQYHALVALRILLNTNKVLSEGQRALVESALESTRIVAGTDRYEVAQQIRSLLTAQADREVATR
ncbi:hypothetical protein [Nocardia sp. NPDC050175]|uniref:hypothetical protein n=1 Tax=Nocardia sp. NPDC050175 TaxID=3364317 RepID=UPI0037962481